MGICSSIWKFITTKQEINISKKQFHNLMHALEKEGIELLEFKLNEYDPTYAIMDFTSFLDQKKPNFYYSLMKRENKLVLGKTIPDLGEGNSGISTQYSFRGSGISFILSRFGYKIRARFSVEFTSEEEKNENGKHKHYEFDTRLFRVFPVGKSNEDESKKRRNAQIVYECLNCID